MATLGMLTAPTCAESHSSGCQAELEDGTCDQLPQGNMSGVNLHFAISIPPHGVYTRVLRREVCTIIPIWQVRKPRLRELNLAKVSWLINGGVGINARF